MFQQKVAYLADGVPDPQEHALHGILDEEPRDVNNFAIIIYIVFRQIRNFFPLLLQRR